MHSTPISAARGCARKIIPPALAVLIWAVLPQLSHATNHYVWISSPSPTPPYTNWTTAAHTIQDAINVAGLDDVVLVTNGTYSVGSTVTPGYHCLNRVVINTNITVQSINGAQVTTIDGGGSVRCAYVAYGTLRGFTITGGETLWYDDEYNDQSGGGVLCGDFGEIRDCIICGNHAWNNGGGISQGSASDCEIYDNRAEGEGGGTLSCSLTCCGVYSNSSLWSGGGCYGGTIDSCAIYDNQSGAYGGGCYDGILHNCTISRNQACFGGGAYTCSVYNTIMYANRANGGDNWMGLSECKYSCSTPLPPGEGNFAADPQLLDRRHISLSSPCVDNGSSAFATPSDIDGQAWHVPPTVGCDEPTTNSGTLQVSLDPSFVRVVTGMPLCLRAQISGLPMSNTWTVSDGSVQLTNSFVLHHIWTATGIYDVVLTVFNTSYPTGISSTATVEAVDADAATFYADASSASPLPPYTNWASAAAVLQHAVGAAATCAVVGARVLVTDGVYAVGGMLTPGGRLTSSNRVTITNAIIVCSVNGPQATIISGQGPNGTSAVRGVYMSAGILCGFTITNGYTRTTGNTYMDCSGGGINALSGLAVISNCIFCGNSADYFGSAACGGYFSGCLFSNNTIQYGDATAALIVGTNCTFATNYAQRAGGAYRSILYNCTLENNSVLYYGGGALWSTLYGCTVSNNTTPYSGTWGGGIYGCRFYDGTIISNFAAYGGGAYESTVSNSLLKGNRASQYGGGAHLSTLYRCILNGNVSDQDGGGTDGGTLYNCLLLKNEANGVVYGPPDIPSGKGGGANCGTLYNCTVVSNYATDRAGGVYAATCYNTIIWTNRAGVTNDNYESSTLHYCCTLPDAGWPNRTNDPRFIDPANDDYHLGVYSECVDGGTNLAGIVDDDLEGIARPIDGDLNGSNAWDIGCYEYNAWTSDSDSDTMPDGWEYINGLNPTNAADADADPDGDYVPNRDEYVADTVPTNASSYFHIIAISNADARTVTFGCSTGRVYTLQASTNLTGQSWQTVPGQSGTHGDTSGLMSMTDTNATPLRQYRVRVALP